MQGLAEPEPGLPTEGRTTPMGITVQPLQRTVTIQDPAGLHMRPASMIAARARQFDSRITLRLRDREANAKSQIDMMLLDAPCGSEISVEVLGNDAALALEAMAEILQSQFDHDLGSEPPPKG